MMSFYYLIPHLDLSVDSYEIEIGGYQLFRRDRNRSGGGVLTYARNTLQPVLSTDLDQKGMKFLFIKLLGISFPLYFGVYYRQPNQSKLNAMHFVRAYEFSLTILCQILKLSYLCLVILMINATIGMIIIMRASLICH